MKTGSETVKDEVLYAFSVEPNRDATTLGKYLEAFPEYREDLINLSIELFFEPKQEDVFIETTVTVGEGANRAWEKFQSKLSASDPIFAPEPIYNPLASLDRQSFSKLAKSLGINRLFLSLLRDNSIRYSSIPKGFIQLLAEAVNVNVNVMVDALNRSASISSTQSFKADCKPSITEPVSFEEAIELSNLSEEQKAVLRAFES